MIKQHRLLAGILGSLVLLPSLAMALTGTFKDVVGYVLGMIYLIIPILFGLAFIVFFWGLSKFILNSGNQTELKKGKEYIMWGILALFILISFRGIIAFLSGEFEFGPVKYPFLKSTSSDPDTSKLIIPKIPGQN